MNFYMPEEREIRGLGLAELQNLLPKAQANLRSANRKSDRRLIKKRIQVIESEIKRKQKNPLPLPKIMRTSEKKQKHNPPAVVNYSKNNKKTNWKKDSLLSSIDDFIGGKNEKGIYKDL